MPRSVEDLVDLLDLEAIDVDVFRGRQAETARQRVFGGQVAAQSLAAAAATVPAERVVHSMHGYFLRPGATSTPIVYRTENLRDGGSFSSRRVVATQRGEVIFFMSASFQRPEEGLEHADEMPDVPPPEESRSLAEVYAELSRHPREEWDAEWAALDLRLASQERPSFWLRAAGPLPDEPRLHAEVLTYASDLTLLGAAVIPHGMFIQDPRLRAASLDHAIWFHREFRADEWLLYDQSSPSASGARGFALGRLFTRDGRLVASTAQEGLIRLAGDGVGD